MIIDIIILVIACILGGLLWFDRIRPVPLSDFGFENVQRVLRWESDDLREQIWARGWLTRSQWRQLLKRQQLRMDLEIARRSSP